jgi:hypothetical protein
MYKRLLVTSALLIASPAWAASDDSSPPSTTTPGSATTTSAAAAGAAASSAAQAPAAGLTPEQQVQLLQEVQALRERVQALEARSTQVQYTPEAPEHHKLLGDNNLELYGFVQLDAIQDFDRVNPDWAATLRPSRIPTTSGEFGSNGQTIFSVRQSRLGAKASGMISGKPYEAKVEFDLYGTGDDAGQTTIRFRHVYASWGPILVGQHGACSLSHHRLQPQPLFLELGSETGGGHFHEASGIARAKG